MNDVARRDRWETTTSRPVPDALCERLCVASDVASLARATQTELATALGADEAQIVISPAAGLTPPAADEHAWTSLTSETLELALHRNGRLVTRIALRRHRSAFSVEEIDRATRALPGVRAAWTIMSHRQQTRRLSRIVSDGLGADTGVILIDHARIDVLDLGDVAADVLTPGRPTLRPGRGVPEPLGGLLRDTRQQADQTHTRFGPYRVAESTIRIHGADRGFGGEVVLVSRGRGGDPSTIPVTVRQREVLDLVGKGYSNKEVAARLGIATTTVKKHLQLVYEAFGVTSRTAAVHRLNDDTTATGVS